MPTYQKKMVVFSALRTIAVAVFLTVSIAEGGFSLDLRSADKELKAVTPEK